MKEHETGVFSVSAERQDVPPSISRRRKLASSVALAVAGAALLGAYDVSAAPADEAKKAAGGEPSVAELKAQVERLTRELEASKQREQDLIDQGAAEAPLDTPVAAGAVAGGNGQGEAVAAAEPQAEEEKPEEPKNLAEVTVTSRRKEEKLQDVPIPIAVIGGEQMKRDNIVSVQDFARRVPNLGVTNTNARQTSIALRGLGKNSGNESMESSVGVMIDNVWQSWVGSTWVNFADIDHVEVLRGPQGTLQGKNSNLGLINVVSQTPSFKSGYYADGFAGNRNSLQGKFGATGTILPGLLAYRASGYIDKRDGWVQNLDVAVTDGKLQETDSMGGRLQFLLTPSDTLSARFILDRTSSTQSMSVNPNMLDPATFADGTVRPTTYSSRLARDWFDVFERSGQPITVIGDPRKVAQDNKLKSRADSEGVSAEINWDVLGHRFTSVSAYRNSLFEPHHDGDRSVADIMRIGGVTVDNEQWSQEFRIASKEPGPIDYQAGVFTMRSVAETLSQNHYGDDAGAFYASNAQYGRLNSTAVGRQMMSASMRELMDTAYLNPATDSYAAYGQINWHITDAATLTLGLRDTFEQRSNSGNHYAIGGADLTALASSIGATAQNLTDALAIRSGQIKPNWVAARQGFDQNSQNWLVNPSYKITDDIMAYFSVAGGQKSGAAQFNANTGEVENVDPENVMDYELGIKSSWLNKTLVFNLNLYQTDIEGFQSQLVIPDEVRPGQFRTRLGNVDGIQLRGIELESSWDVTPGLNLFMNGSYNHAIYTDFKNAPCPPEANKAVCDQTGLTLPNAPAFTANFGFDYRVPFGFGVVDDYGLQWHAYMVDSFKSAANYNASLSASGKQPAYHVTDGGIGLGTKDGKYNLDLVGRNVFDTIYLTNSSNWSSTGASTGTYGDARYYGVHFRAKF
ncbi:TonB-dependent receptor [Methylomicrobium album]|uniref:Outer membrane receptor protein n=1 Tax=Methylomicrobium album BG8 TaxID=686340 RepID=H8GMP2_METAL|nr:TonB-dependent receptor [Methylomicrobium album]EIC28282.1 outer membrane receptor protein [Methylomicrobium album BG8]